jgi:rhodanese-related sulfurtransferase
VKRALLVAAILAGALAPLAGSPYRSTQLDVKRLAATIAKEDDHVTAAELAQWIRSRKAGLQIIDLRTPKEFAEVRVPTSINLTLAELVQRDFPRADTIVLVSDGGGHAAQGWVLMQARGYANVYFLRGGMQEWEAALAQPGELRRYFGGARRGGGC